MEKLDDVLDGLLNIHQKIVDDVPELKQGLVKCTTCGKELKVNSARCLQYGWPECCGETMRLRKTI